jgi:hypothetical protein
LLKQIAFVYPLSRYTYDPIAGLPKRKTTLSKNFPKGKKLGMSSVVNRLIPFLVVNGLHLDGSSAILLPLSLCLTCHHSYIHPSQMFSVGGFFLRYPAFRRDRFRMAFAFLEAYSI